MKIALFPALGLLALAGCAGYADIPNHIDAPARPDRGYTTTGSRIPAGPARPVAASSQRVDIIDRSEIEAARPRSVGDALRRKGL